MRVCHYIKCCNIKSWCEGQSHDSEHVSQQGFASTLSTFNLFVHFVQFPWYFSFFRTSKFPAVRLPVSIVLISTSTHLLAIIFVFPSLSRAYLAWSMVTVNFSRYVMRDTGVDIDELRWDPAIYKPSQFYGELAELYARIEDYLGLDLKEWVLFVKTS